MTLKWRSQTPPTAPLSPLWKGDLFVPRVDFFAGLWNLIHVDFFFQAAVKTPVTLSNTVCIPHLVAPRCVSRSPTCRESPAQMLCNKKWRKMFQTQMQLCFCSRGIDHPSVFMVPEHSNHRLCVRNGHSHCDITHCEVGICRDELTFAGSSECLLYSFVWFCCVKLS